MTDNFSALAQKMEPYLDAINMTNVSQLDAQYGLESTGLELIDFSDKSNSKGRWLQNFTERAKVLLGSSVKDTNGTSDLVINKLLRDNILDDEQVLRINGIEINTDDLIISNGTEPLVNITIIPTSVTVSGLDSSTAFEPLKIIGPNSLQNKFHWDYLKIKMEWSVTIKTLTRKNRENPNAQIDVPYIHLDSVSLEMLLSDIDALALLRMAIDKDLAEHVKIFNMLNYTHYLPCLRNVSHNFNLTQLEINIGAFDTPTVSGLISPGIDEIINNIFHVISVLYGNIFKTILPNYIATSGRAWLNQWNKNGDNNCPVYDSEMHHTMLLDFRDLLLSSNKAIELGGSGDNPYGSIMSLGYEAVTIFLTRENNITGIPSINEKLIAPLTEKQSNKTGTLSFGKQNISVYSSKILKNIGEISVSNIQIHHLDTISYPLSLMQPKIHQKHILDSKFTIGGDPKPLKITSRVKLKLDVPVYMNKRWIISNDVDVHMNVVNMVVLLSVMLKINVTSFLSFPLLDIGNPYCWLATASSSIKDITSMAQIKSFHLTAEEMSLDVECKKCDSKGIKELQSIISLLQYHGITDNLYESILSIIESIMESEFAQNMIDRTLKEASTMCPHHEDYGNEIVEEGGTSQLSFLSTRESVETAALSGFMAFQILVVVVAVSFDRLDDNVIENTNPLLGQDLLDEAAEGLIDFTGANKGTVGYYVGVGLSIINNFIKKNSEDEINNLVRSFLSLDDDGYYSVDVNNKSSANNDVFTLKSIRLFGLDTISRLDQFDAIGPQTIQTGFSVANLKIEVDVAVNSSLVQSEELEQIETMTFDIQMSDVNLTLAFLLAVNEEELSNIPF